MSEKLTLAQLNAIAPGAVFAKGIAINPTDIFVSSDCLGREVLWLAKKGSANDWCIYLHWADKGEAFVETNGDKLFNETVIKNFVPCSDDVFKKYRY